MKPPDVFLQPGEYFVGAAPARVRTLLGSCVSTTLWCDNPRVGAMSHSLLPTRGAARGAGRSPDARYCDEALELMLDGLHSLGVEPRRCQAKVFGGGQMFAGRGSAAMVPVGSRNGEAARALLRAQGIEVVSESLFGAGHRQIIFDIGSGHVWSRQVPPAPRALPQREAAA